MDIGQIEQRVDASVATSQSVKLHALEVLAVGDCIVDCLRAGGKILTAGNGGSAAEALHMAEELVGRYVSDRPSLAGISLVADPTALTCIANDYGYDEVFSRQVQGLGREGDVLVLFSTSGNSINLQRALEEGKGSGVTTVAILGRDGGAIAGKADLEIILEGSATERIQEGHQLMLHLILDIVEEAFAQ